MYCICYADSYPLACLALFHMYSRLLIFLFKINVFVKHSLSANQFAKVINREKTRSWRGKSKLCCFLIFEVLNISEGSVFFSRLLRGRNSCRCAV